MIHKTQFTPQDESRLKDFIKMPLPADARVDWAMFFHTFNSDTCIVFRTRLPSEEAKKIRQHFESLGARNVFYQSELLDPDPQDETKPELEAAFMMEDLKIDAIVFCKPENGDVPVYFEIEGWPERDIHDLDGIFFPTQ